MHLYSKQLLQQAKNPSHAGILQDATHSTTHNNPLCGDRIQWTIRVVANHIDDVRHHTRGCALCIASASLLSKRIVGQKIPHVVNKIQAFTQQVNQMLETEDDVEDTLLNTFTGLRHAPSRKTCVLLPWEGLKEAITKDK